MVKYLNSETPHTLRLMNNLKDALPAVCQLLQTLVPSRRAVKNMRNSCQVDPVAAPYHTIRATTRSFQDFSFLISPFSIQKPSLLWFSLLPVSEDVWPWPASAFELTFTYNVDMSTNGSVCIRVILYLKYLLKYGYIPRFSVVKQGSNH